MPSLYKFGYRSLKWLSAAVLLVVLVAALAIEVMPWNFLKPTLARQFEAATGRSLNLDGTLSLSLFPRPTASIRAVTLGNPDGFDSPHLLEAERFSASLALLPLMAGNLVLETVRLEDVDVHLETRSGVNGNWQFQGFSDTDTAPSRRPSGLRTLPVRHLSVSRAEIRYYPPDSDRSRQALLPSLDVHNGVDAIDARAEAVYRDRDFIVDVNADPLDRWLDASNEASLNAIVGSADSRLRAQLTRPGSDARASLRGRADLTLANSGGWSRWLGGPEVNLGTVHLSTRVEQDNDRWQFTDLEASIADQRASGAITLHTGQSGNRFVAEFNADEFDASALRRAWPQSPGRSRGAGIELPVFPAINGELDLAVSRLSLGEAILEDVRAQLTLADRSLAVDPLSFRAGGGTVNGTARLTGGTDQVAAEAAMMLNAIETSLAPLPTPVPGTLDADLSVAVGPLPRSELTPERMLERLRIDRAEVDYRARRHDVEATVLLELDETGQVPTVSVAGRYRAQPFQVRVEGGPLPGLLDDIDYPLLVEASSGRLTASAHTDLDAVISPRTLAADVRLSGEGTDDLEPWLGTQLPSLPPFELAGRLEREQSEWSATDIDLALGDTRLNGQVSWQGGDRPRLNAELSGGQVDLVGLLATKTSDARAASDRRNEAGTVAFLNRFDGRLALRTDAMNIGAQRSLRNVALVVELDDGRLVADPFQADFAGGALAATASLNANTQPAAGRVDATLDDIALDRVGDGFMVLEDNLGQVSGELHIDITEADADALTDNVLLPSIGRLGFEESRLRFVDPEARTDLELRIVSEESGAGEPPLRVIGTGHYDGDPFSLELRGDPLLNARLPDRPYALELMSDIVATRIELAGDITQPLALKGVDLTLDISGPNINHLQRILGIPLPSLPRYSLSSGLSLEDSRWALTRIEGVTGDSDLSGDLALVTDVSPPHISGQLLSEDLDLDDLSGLIGAADGDAGDADEEPARTDEREQEDADRYVLPDEPVLGTALQGVSADVGYRADSVRAADIPLRDLAIDVRIEDGRMRLDPVRFGIGEGRVDVSMDLDATADPPQGSVNTEVQGVDLDVALQHWELAKDSVGVVGGQGQFWVRGASVHALFASADGGMVLLMTQGRLDALLVELAGLDMGEAFFSWLGDRMAVPIHCAYADIKAEDGIATLDTAVIDSADSLFTAGGTVDFNTEKLDITFLTHPKDFSPLAARTPLHLGGTFANIEPGLHGSELSLRLATSLTLSAIAAPIAALMPLLDPGVDEDANYCQGTVERIREATQRNEEEP